jgi:hypothetical protein
MLYEQLTQAIIEDNAIVIESIVDKIDIEVIGENTEVEWLGLLSGYTNRGGRDAKYEMVREKLFNKITDYVFNVKDDSNGITMLFLASGLGYTDVVAKLLGKMAPEFINSKLHNHTSALHRSAERGHDEVSVLLINSMGREVIEAQDQAGFTALHFAARNGLVRTVELLLRSHCEF